MTAVRCPWCDRRLVAADGDVLSNALAVHFHRDHGLVLPDPEMLTGGREGKVSTREEFEGEMGESDARKGSEAYGSTTTEREGALYGVQGPPRTIVMQRADETPYVACPLCGLEVQGRDEGELSRKLKDHMRQMNELGSAR